MKKLFLIIFLCVFLPVITSAVTFKDMSESHWAADSVQKIVEMGVTRGYPDGTFRGTKTINRYDLAVFLAKMAEYLESKSGGTDASSFTDTGSTNSTDMSSNNLEAEIAALKTEIAALKAEITALKK